MYSLMKFGIQLGSIPCDAFDLATERFDLPKRNLLQV